MFTPVCRLIGHGSDVVRGRISPDLSTISTCSADKSLYVWDPTTGESIRAFYGHGKELTDLVYHGSGSGIFTSSVDGDVRLFDLRSSSPGASLTFPGTTVHAEYADEYTCLTAGNGANSSLLLAGTSGGYLKFFDARKGSEVISTFAHYNTVCSLETSPNDSMVTSSSLDGTIRIWSASHGDCLMTVNEGTSNPAPCVYSGFSADCEGFIGLFLDSTVRRWSLRDRIASQGKATGPKMTSSTKTFTRTSGFGGIAVPSEDGYVHFLDFMSGKPTQAPTKAHCDDVLSVDCRDNLLISTGAGEDSSCVIWARLSEADSSFVKTDYNLSFNLVSPQIEGLI